MNQLIVFVRNRIQDALPKFGLAVFNSTRGQFSLARYNVLSGIRILGIRIMLILVAISAVALFALVLSNEPRVTCPEDAALVHIGMGQYERGQWDEYRVECIAMDDIYHPR